MRIRSIAHGGAENGGRSAPESVGRANVKRTVASRVRNAAYRSCERLTEREVELQPPIGAAILLAIGPFGFAALHNQCD